MDLQVGSRIQNGKMHNYKHIKIPYDFSSKRFMRKKNSEISQAKVATVFIENRGNRDFFVYFDRTKIACLLPRIFTKL